MNFKNPLPNLKRDIKNKIKNLKNKAQNAAQRFSKKISEAKSKPRSKRESLFLGFTTVLGIFSVTLVASAIPAIAQDPPLKKPKLKKVRTNKSTSLVSSEEILKALSGAAATVCGLAVSSGSFMLGAVCGLVVVVGILKAQGR